MMLLDDRGQVMGPPPGVLELTVLSLLFLVTLEISGSVVLSAGAVIAFIAVVVLGVEYRRRGVSEKP